MATQITSNEILLFEPFRLDASQRLLFRDNEEIPLPPKILDTLLVLVQHQGRVLDKDYLMKLIWPGSFVEEGSLARNISLLRKTLGVRKTLGECPDDQRFIQTIPKRGYRFVAPVQTLLADESAPSHHNGKKLGATLNHEVLMEEPDRVARTQNAIIARGADRIEIEPVPPAIPHPDSIPLRFHLYAALACLIVAVTTAIAVWNMRTAPPPLVTRTAIALPSDLRLLPTLDVPIALSPDGRQLAYVAKEGVAGLPRLYVRLLSQREDRPLAGTERANHPFFSPDGQWIGFFSGGNLKKVSLTSGAVITICRTGADLRGASWGAGNRIVFGTDGSTGLFVVSADGGVPEPLTTVAEGESNHRWPELLPGGKALLFTVGMEGSYDNASIAVQRLDGTTHTILLQGGTFPHYLASGHLVYSRADSILAVAFDLKGLEVRSSPVPMVESMSAPTSPIGAAPFAVSTAGTLAYVPYSPQEGAMKLVWVDRDGSAKELGHDGTYDFEQGSYPRLSPDNDQVAIQVNGRRRDVWIYSISRGTIVRFTHEGINSKPTWTPDGRRVVYQSNRAGRSNLFWQPTHGRGPEEPMTPSSPGTQYPGSFSPDGHVFLYSEIRPGTGRDIFFLRVEGDRTPQVYIQTPSDETTPRFSPDGRYVAYVSDETRRNEVYLQPITSNGAKYRISVDGGAEVVWGKTGELFYRSGSRMMAVQVRTEPSLEIGRLQELFEGPFLLSSSRAANYDVSTNGQRFLMLKRVGWEISAPTLINIVQNWSEELKKKVPVK